MPLLESIAAAQPFLEQIQAGFVVLDTKLEPVWSNRYYREEIENLPGICGKHCFTGLPPGETRCEDCLPPQVQRSGRTLTTIRTTRHLDGRLAYYRVVIFPLEEGSGLVAALIHPVPAEEMESESSWRERFLLSAIRNSSEGVFALDRLHTVRFWNRGAERIFGWSIDEMVGRPIHPLFPEEDRAAAEDLFTPSDPSAPLRDRELRLVTRSGNQIWVELSRTPLLDGSGNPTGYSFVARDITERKQALEKMAFTERMSAVGNMAAALAHEIGTPLGIISGNAEMLQLDLPADDPRREELESIVHEAERIGGLVRELLHFSRPDVPEMEALELPDVVRRVERLVRHASKKQGSEVVVGIEATLDPLLGDANQLEQVILNLTMNALQALESGGQVFIGVRRSEPEDTLGEGRPGLILSVWDTGPGLGPDLTEQIFHPFFTTKPNGTGLGLAVAKRIVEEHGGAIAAHDLDEGGACFAIWLPTISNERSG